MKHTHNVHSMTTNDITSFRISENHAPAFGLGVTFIKTPQWREENSSRIFGSRHAAAARINILYFIYKYGWMYNIICVRSSQGESCVVIPGSCPIGEPVLTGRDNYHQLIGYILFGFRCAASSRDHFSISNA